MPDSFSGDSRINANLVPVWPRALRLGRPKTDPAIPLAALLESIAERASDFDVIHCHTDWVHLPLLTRLGVPFVTTTHNRLDLPGLPRLISQFPDAPFSAFGALSPFLPAFLLSRQLRPDEIGFMLTTARLIARPFAGRAQKMRK